MGGVRVGALFLLWLACAAPGVRGTCSRAPTCSCCEYKRAAKGAGTAIEARAGGNAQRVKSIPPMGAYYKLKAACSRWVQLNKGFKEYICHIFDGPVAGQYRAMAYAGEDLQITRFPANQCKSGAVGGELMRTNVIYGCIVDPPPPPSPPPHSPPHSPPPMTGQNNTFLGKGHGLSRWRLPFGRRGNRTTSSVESSSTGASIAITIVILVAILVMCVGVGLVFMTGGSLADPGRMLDWVFRQRARPMDVEPADDED